MSEDRPSEEEATRDDEASARRRRLAAVFGEVLPEQTRDDRAADDAEPDRSEWLQREVPPHHGG